VPIEPDLCMRQAQEAKQAAVQRFSALSAIEEQCGVQVRGVARGLLCGEPHKHGVVCIGELATAAKPARGYPAHSVGTIQDAERAMLRSITDSLGVLVALGSPRPCKPSRTPTAARFPTWHFGLNAKQKVVIRLMALTDDLGPTHKDTGCGRSSSVNHSAVVRPQL
jgi:hypothetical protein